MQAIGTLIQTVADDFVRLQRDIDLNNFHRLAQYAITWQKVRPMSPELADALIPSTQSLSHVAVDVNFQFVRTAAREFSLELSILNLGYATKFGSAQFGRCSIHVELTRDNSAPRRLSNG